MKIKTQFIVTTFIFGIILLVMAAALIITNQRIDLTNRQEAIAASVQQGANELGYLSSDYLIYRENQQFTRWEAKFAALSSDLASLKPETPEQQTLVNNLQTNQQQLKNVFEEVKATIEKSPNPGTVVDPAFIKVSWSRMEVQNQGLIFNASRLLQVLGDQENQLKQNISWLIFILVGVFGAFVLSNYYLNYRRTLKSITVLQNGTKVIGSGNLDYTIPEKGKDEISDLSRAFNRMGADLKKVTASKADLEKEVADRKKAEEALEQYARNLEAANKELEAFAYSVSHDLRQPLRALDGFSLAVVNNLGDKLDDTNKDYLNRVRKASQTMGQLIDDLLKLSRINRADMSYNKVNLSDLAGSIAEELKNRHPERQVEFRITSGLMVKGDKQLLNIALRNILENAWKFSSKCPQARIEMGAIHQNGEKVYFLKDNGIGFDMKYVDKLFQPFQRLHSGKDYEGTGIGLATVQRIIHRHGGRAWAESEISKGTTIYFTLGE